MRRLKPTCIALGCALVLSTGLTYASSFFAEDTSQQTFLQDAYQRIYKEKVKHGDPYIEWMSERTRRILERAKGEEAHRALIHLSTFLDLQEDTLNNAVMLPYQTTRMSKDQFLSVYGPYVTSTNTLPERCFDYYDQIDAVARKNNVPTALIIASWYKEAGCNMINPGNGDGIFQIVSHSYGAGPISTSQLLVQVQHFIDFCYAKRNAYKKIHRYDDVPVQITYEGWSLQDLRKQSVLYNGMYANVTLENSWYANNGFAGYARPEYSSQDGLVTLVLKVLAHQQKYALR